MFRNIAVSCVKSPPATSALRSMSSSVRQPLGRNVESLAKKGIKRLGEYEIQGNALKDIPASALIAPGITGTILVGMGYSAKSFYSSEWCEWDGY